MVTTKDKRMIAILYAPENGSLEALVNDLECHNFSIVVVNTLGELRSPSIGDSDVVGVYVFDLTDEKTSFIDCMACIDPGFMSDRGSIIAYVPDDKVDYEVLLAEGATKITKASKGRDPLRIAISSEIEDFERIAYVRKELSKRPAAIGEIVSGEFRLKTRREAQNLAMMLSTTCPNPMPMAIGLTELLINGVEHGCLGIGHKEKGELIAEGRLVEELQNRRLMPEYSENYVTLTYERKEDRMQFVIKDEGKGFDHRSYTTDIKGHTKKHGRGIMMAQGCFQRIDYKGNGNEVHAVHLFEDAETESVA